MSMHQDLLRAYRQELQFLRDVGSEFGKAHPQLGKSLALDSSTASDPFVERLLEGIAFLTAKTSMRLDNEHVRLRQDLFSVLMPDLLCPLPPASIVEFLPLPSLSATSRFVIPSGTHLRYCKDPSLEYVFRTVSPVQLAPLQIEVLDLPSAGVVSQMVQTARMSGMHLQISDSQLVRVKISGLGEKPVKHCLPKDIKLFFKGSDEGAMLWQVLTQKPLALMLITEQGKLLRLHHKPTLTPEGFGDEEALLPSDCVPASPLRLLREWLFWPERFGFAVLHDLVDSLHDHNENSIELWWFVKKNKQFPHAWSDKVIRLSCAPVVNLSQNQCEPINLSATQSEYPIKVNSSTKPLRELISISEVHHLHPQKGWQTLNHLPMSEQNKSWSSANYSIRQSPRWTKVEHHVHPEATIEWRISPHVLVEDESEILTITAWTCQKTKNAIRPADRDHWKLDYSAPIISVHGVDDGIQQIAYGTTPPMKVLSFRVDKLAQMPALEAMAVFKEWLELTGATNWSEGITSFDMKLATRRVPHRGPVIHAQGWVISIGIDEITSLRPQLAMWQVVMATTLCKQLYNEAFLELHLNSREQTFEPYRIWR